MTSGSMNWNGNKPFLFSQHNVMMTASSSHGYGLVASNPHTTLLSPSLCNAEVTSFVWIQWTCLRCLCPPPRQRRRRLLLVFRLHLGRRHSLPGKAQWSPRHHERHCTLQDPQQR
jgi:hypothetical protein